MKAKVNAGRFSGFIPEVSFAMVASSTEKNNSFPLPSSDGWMMGEGTEHSRLLFVGEAPGAPEAAEGRPFVGPAGQLLDKMLEAMGTSRKKVYLTNVIKYQLPNNRKPLVSEIEAALPFLAAELRIVQAKVVIALGVTAAQALLKTDSSLASLRGKVHSLRVQDREMSLIVTDHPAYLLKHPSAKKDCWEDLKGAIKILKDLE